MFLPRNSCCFARRCVVSLDVVASTRNDVASVRKCREEKGSNSVTAHAKFEEDKSSCGLTAIAIANGSIVPVDFSDTCLRMVGCTVVEASFVRRELGQSNRSIQLRGSSSHLLGMNASLVPSQSVP